MKKIILCILLIGVLILVASCDDNTVDLSKLENERQATIILPDGSIINGKCTNFMRYGDSWAYITINGTKYYIDTWRIVMWEKTIN